MSATATPTRHRAGLEGPVGSAQVRRSNERRTKPWLSRQSFVNELELLPFDRWQQLADSATETEVARALATKRPGPAQVAALVSKTASTRLDELTERAQRLTRQRFGNTVQLFAPLYLSNECVSTCLYCGFAMKNRTPRKTLTMAELETELETLANRRFRHQLLVSGEHPKAVSVAYLVDAVCTAKRWAPFVQLEVQAQDQTTYELLRPAGLDGVVIYQETYDRKAYERLHPYGVKKSIEYRLDAPDRIGRARIKRVGLGVLLGLTERWRTDVVALAAHAQYMQRQYWRTQVTVALPRLKPAVGGFEGPTVVGNRDFLQAICALRLALPEAGIVLSTREPQELRDALIGVGVTQMSAGSSTAPGGYEHPGEAEAQFAIDDERSATEVAAAIAAHGYEPVWKDWERGI